MVPHLLGQARLRVHGASALDAAVSPIDRPSPSFEGALNFSKYVLEVLLPSRNAIDLVPHLLGQAIASLRVHGASALDAAVSPIDRPSSFSHVTLAMRQQ